MIWIHTHTDPAVARDGGMLLDPKMCSIPGTILGAMHMMEWSSGAGRIWPVVADGRWYRVIRGALPMPDGHGIYDP